MPSPLRRRFSLLSAAGTVLILFTPAARAGDAVGSARPSYRVPSTRESIEIDARLQEEAWRGALRIPLELETDPAENAPAPVRTVVLLTSDADHFYVAFRAFDPEPEKIRARFADRDQAGNDDLVGVVLDTFNDERRAFHFLVNPLGVQVDRTQDDVNGRIDGSWDAIWKSAGRITETGYIVELAVPYSSLRFQRGDGGTQTWGFEAMRTYPRADRHRLSNVPRDRGVSCRLCQLSKIVGFEHASPGRNLEINPTVTGSYLETRDDFPDGELGDGEDSSEPGVTVRWGVTPNLTVSSTLNPDFSQVEADTAQLDINTQFALFFPERRPFFLEGADLFSSPLRTVFTRNVADPAWGLKLTGKEGANAIGVFAAQDEITNLIFPGSQGSSSGSFDFETVDTVLRYRRDLAGQSTLGAMVTSREGDGYSNRVYGLDGMFRFSDSDTVRVQALQSRTEYPFEIAEDFDQPRDAFSDEAWTLRYTHRERDWSAWVNYEDVGAGFRADMGFVPQVGYANLRAGGSRTWWGDDSTWYNRFQVGGSGGRRQDSSGELLDEVTEAWVSIDGPRQSELFMSAGQRTRRFDGVDFDNDFVHLWFDFQPTGAFWFGLRANVADAIDFAHARPGESVSFEPMIRVDLGQHVRLNLSHSIRRLDVEGGRLFEAALTQLKMVYQLNLRAFVRAIVQYTDIRRDPSLYEEDVETKTSRAFNQLLFGYKMNPRTVLYLGYSDSYSGNQDVTLTQENRALFMKVGYAWVL